MMAASVNDVARLRRMIAEPTDSTYDDDTLEEAIERYPVMDLEKNDPTLDDGSDNSAWTATYDLAAAAAEIWTEKAAALAGSYDFAADGGSFNLNQMYQNAMNQSRYWSSRRKAGTITLRAEPE